MIVSIMQPYLFPYIGYFQLMSCSDVFVIHDDVQYIQGGWINRNRILIDDEAQWLSLPVASADYRQPINQRHYLLEDRLASKFRRRIVGAYACAPYFKNVMPVIDEILMHDDSNVARFNANQLRQVSSYMGIDKPITLSSSIEKDDRLAGQERVIELCKTVGANCYINPAGGLTLYQPDRFFGAGIELRFLQSMAPEYPQGNGAHVKSLSIIDVLMFNDLPRIKSMLTQYQLIGGHKSLSNAGNESAR